jgi:hypothetical protein
MRAGRTTKCRIVFSTTIAGMPRALVALGAAACAVMALAPAFASAATSAPCRSSAVLSLDVGAAARIPEASGATTAPVGAARAATIANTLRAGVGNICTMPPTAHVASELQVISSLYAAGQRATAHGRLIALLAQIKRRPVRPQPLARILAAAPCKAARVDVKLKGATKAADALKAAAAALQAHDQAAADQATAQAKAAYGEWADNGSGAASAGDYVALAAGAEKLGAGDTANRMLDKARAAADAELKARSKVDKCTASAADLDCFTKANVVAELVGASDSVDLAAAGDIAQSLADRLNHKTPAGCEEWSFTMKAVDTTTGWGITWGAGRFRVNRKTGVIDGSQAAGYGKGWGGIIGNWNGRCIETTPDGTTDLGPSAIVGGAFHYTIDGTVDGGGFYLQIASPDGHADVQEPADPICQWLGTLAQQFVDLFVSGPNEIDVPVGPNDKTFTVDNSDGGFTLTVTVTRVS